MIQAVAPTVECPSTKVLQHQVEDAVLNSAVPHSNGLSLTQNLHDMNIGIRNGIHAQHSPKRQPQLASLTNSNGSLLPLAKDPKSLRSTVSDSISPIAISPSSACDHDDIESLSNNECTPSPTPRSVHANLNNTYCDSRYITGSPLRPIASPHTNGFTPRNGYYANPFGSNINDNDNDSCDGDGENGNDFGKDHEFDLLPVVLVYGFIRCCLSNSNSPRDDASISCTSPISPTSPSTSTLSTPSSPTHSLLTEMISMEIDTEQMDDDFDNAYGGIASAVNSLSDHFGINENENEDENEDDTSYSNLNGISSDSDMAHVLSSNITQLILLYFDDDKFTEDDGGRQYGSFVWTVPTLELLTSSSMDSIPFQIGSFLWFLSIYPYGVDEEHARFSNLYINLASTNDLLFDSSNVRIKEIVINARLYCVNTKSCWSSIKVFRCDTDYHGWQKGALKVDEMCGHQSLTFIAYINILKISRLKTESLSIPNTITMNPFNSNSNSNNTNSVNSLNSPLNTATATSPSTPSSSQRCELWYQYPLSIERKSRFLIKWKIDESLMKDLQTANEMKRFESDICHNMWVLGCVPNGIKKDNESSVFKMFLKLCALPPSVSRIKVKFNILCVETKKHLKYIYHDFDYKHKYWQTDKLCKRSYLMFDDFSCMRFKAEIEIIEQYDLSMKEMSSSLWRQHMECDQVHRLVTMRFGHRRNTKRDYLLIQGFIRRIVETLEMIPFGFGSSNDGNHGVNGKYESFGFVSVRNYDDDENDHFNDSENENQNETRNGNGNKSGSNQSYLKRNKFDSKMIGGVIMKYHPGDSFTWNIPSEQILKLSQSNTTKHRFDSRLFVQGNLKWFLQVYPNGYRPEDEGYCSVYLILAYLPSVLKEVTIHFGVYCPQTMSNFSTIHTFNHSRDGRGTRRMLSLNHLNTIFGEECRGPITFDCYVNMLRIRVEDKRIIYQYPLTLNNNSCNTTDSSPNSPSDIDGNVHLDSLHVIDGMNGVNGMRHCSFRWTIDREMMGKFRDCKYGQRVESAVFNEMWNLSCFPNEHKLKKGSMDTTEDHHLQRDRDIKEKEQSVVIGLRLCALPRDIGKVTVRYRIRCIEFEDDPQEDVSQWVHSASFDYDN